MSAIRLTPPPLAVALMLAVAALPVSAKRAPQEIAPDADAEIAAATLASKVRFDADGYRAADGVLRAEFRSNYVAKGAGVEARARDYLRHAAKRLSIGDVDGELRFHSARKAGVVDVVRFHQYRDGYRVHGAEVDVSLLPDGRFVYLASAYQPFTAAKRSQAPQVEIATARAQVLQSLGAKGVPQFEHNEYVWYVVDGQARLAIEVHTVPARSPREWRVLIDADSGIELKREELTLHFDGTATTFDPDPLSSAGVTYNTAGYPDNNDLDSAQLTAQTFPRLLRDLTQVGPNWVLTGPYYECVDWDTPNGGTADCPVSATGDFSVTRASQAFEGANTYFHIDKAMRYYNETLGVTVDPNSITGPVEVDPHGWDGADNSSFTGATDRLTFGEGGVDDAEDADVVIHELGHGIHDWVTNGGLSNASGDGLSEGVGDYFAVSYSRALNQWDPADPEYNWVFSWDGHNPFWAGRVTNYHLSQDWPGIGTGVHTPGQYWASCNLLAWEAIGRDKMDKAMLLGLALTNSSARQDTAAQAIINAAVANGFASADIIAIHNAYTRGQANNGCTYPTTLPALPLIFADGFE